MSRLYDAVMTRAFRSCESWRRFCGRRVEKIVDRRISRGKAVPLIERFRLLRAFTARARANRWTRWAHGPLDVVLAVIDWKLGRSRKWKKNEMSRMLRRREALGYR